MALLDTERNVIVIRVVYDGPPEAGKTTSLRALAGDLRRPIQSPDEANGRTQYFDWVDYTGGHFEGYPIRCQIVSVPGQRELGFRRRQLLQGADAIVCVADTGQRNMAGTLTHLRDLPVMLADLPPPAVGVILQANKRDLPDAAPLADIHAGLDRLGLRAAVVESVATEGGGIRETFVFAVRLALDRVREQLRSHTLPEGRPEIDDADALLASMKSVEDAALDGSWTVLAESVPAVAPSAPNAPSTDAADADAPLRADGLASPLLAQVLAENDDAQIDVFAPWRADADAVLDAAPDSAAGTIPRPPAISAPSGAIWPPVDGRMILHDALSGGMTPPRRLRTGDWVAGLGSGWRTYSRANAAFTDLKHGRAMLLQWARMHAACMGWLSPHRCVVLSVAGEGRWRLWQIVRAESSLRDALETLDSRPPSEAASLLFEVASALSDMDAVLATATCYVPCTLDTIGVGAGGPMFIGLMPSRPPQVTPIMRGAALVKAELEPVLSATADERLCELRAAVDHLCRRAWARPSSEVVIEALRELLG